MLRRASAPPQQRLRTALAVLLLSTLGACADDDRAAATDVPDLDAVPALEYEETVRIGSMDDPDHGFSRIGLVTGDDDGNVYVVERRIGRRGDGLRAVEQDELDVPWLVRYELIR